MKSPLHQAIENSSGITDIVIDEYDNEDPHKMQLSRFNAFRTWLKNAENRLSDLAPENERWDFNLLKSEIGLNFPRFGNIKYRYDSDDKEHRIKYSKGF